MSHSHDEIPIVIDENIMHADLVIADLTGFNPSVFYELGKRHAVGGKRVQFTRDNPDGLPVYLRNYRTYKYDALDDEEEIERLRAQFRGELQAQFRSEPRGLGLETLDIVKRFGVTAVTDIEHGDRKHYTFAAEIAKKDCRRMFIMQRSSTLVLGPRSEWDDERSFYDLLHYRISHGTELYHVVNLEGISRHLATAEYPDLKAALGKLKDNEGIVSVRETGCMRNFKRTTKNQEQKDAMPDRQARTFLAEFVDGLSEGLLVLDLGGMPCVVRLCGPKVAQFLDSCVEFYNRCPALKWSELRLVLPGEEKTR